MLVSLKKGGSELQHKISKQEAADWAAGILAQMTLAEKCAYVGGTDGFFTKAIDRLDLPGVLFSDATAGVVVRDRFLETTYQNALSKSTAFPAPIALAATWNLELAERFARAVGEQCNGNGVGVLLGPGFNLYRISQCGRNFEYFGEDPFLISRLVERYVIGVQSTGTIATLKHFVANNTDYFRRKSNSIVDERTLHEIYTPAFKAGIDAGAMAVMTAYNLVNGEWTSQSDYVINHWLRNLLKFEWLVMTDWWAVNDCVKLVNSGQDLEMPASDVTSTLMAKVESGEVSEARVDRMVTSILTTLKAMDLFDKKPTLLSTDDFTRHEAVALQTAREGIVLLRNREQTLPLAAKQPILALGEGMVTRAAGGGSSFVKGYDYVSQLEALSGVFDEIHYDPHPSDAAIRDAPCVLVSLGTRDSESYDRPFALDRNEQRYLERILSLNRNVVVLINSGSGIQMTEWIDKTAAVLYCWYNGQNGSTALAEILSGRTNPSGKLPFTIEKAFADSPGADYLPDGEALYCCENDAWEAAREVYDLPYKEGVFVGYRWYEHRNIQPLFPFGFGLSYTEFEYSDLQVDEAELKTKGELTLTFKVTNIGGHSGAEIAQVYIENAPAPHPRPVKELKGFAKHTIAPGATELYRLCLSRDDFAYWSPEKQDWHTPEGEYTLVVGSSSADIRLKARVTIA